VALRGIVFDFDGVIANSEPLHFRAFSEVLAARGIVLTENAYYAEYLGYEDVEVFRAVASDRGASWDRSEIAAMLEQKAALLEALERDVTVLFPGAEAAIRRAAEAVPIAIASGALRAEIRRVLDWAGLTALFSAIVAAEDCPRGKPAPDPYIRTVALLSTAAAAAPLSASECVAVEDSRWGLESAHAAGLHTVGVAHTYEATALSGADLVIEDLSSFTIDALREICGG
jgi:beta-phosphoglucomutase